MLCNGPIVYKSDLCVRLVEQMRYIMWVKYPGLGLYVHIPCLDIEADPWSPNVRKVLSHGWNVLAFWLTFESASKGWR